MCQGPNRPSRSKVLLHEVFAWGRVGGRGGGSGGTQCPPMPSGFGTDLEREWRMRSRRKENGSSEALVGSFMQVPAALAAGLSASNAMISGRAKFAWSTRKLHGSASLIITNFEAFEALLTHHSSFIKILAIFR